MVTLVVTVAVVLVDLSALSNLSSLARLHGRISDAWNLNSPGGICPPWGRKNKANQLTPLDFSSYPWRLHSEMFLPSCLRDTGTPRSLHGARRGPWSDFSNICGVKGRICEGNRRYCCVNSPEFNVSSPDVRRALRPLPITSAHACTQTPASVGGAAPPYLASWEDCPGGQPSLTVICSDSVLTTHRKQWRGHCSPATSGASLLRACPLCRRKERHVLPLETFFCSLGNKSLPLPPTPDSPSWERLQKGPQVQCLHSPPSTLGK